METFFERVLLEVAVIALQLAILQVVRWLRGRPVGGIVVN
jgi:hypothetical protein